MDTTRLTQGLLVLSQAVRGIRVDAHLALTLSCGPVLSPCNIHCYPYSIRASEVPWVPWAF